MNRVELIDAIAGNSGMDRKQTAATVDAILDVIRMTVAGGHTVQLVGFGSFGSGWRAARTGRNPATGDPIRIAAAKTVKFTAGKTFKHAVNSAKRK